MQRYRLSDSRRRSAIFVRTRRSRRRGSRSCGSCGQLRNPTGSGMKIGIVGVSGYGGSELLRLCSAHPAFEIAYVAGESSAGQSLAQRFPALAGHPAGKLEIRPFAPEKVSGLDLLFASLPTGKSREPLGRVDKNIRIVDIGGDHRLLEGWTYGLTEFPGQRDRIRGATRIANPGCYAAPALLALAPLLKEGLVEAEGIIIDA